MSFVKMTDILVSTPAFIVTLTHRAANQDAILEVTPIVQVAQTEVGLAQQFFHIITSDSTNHNKRNKDAKLEAFVKGCSQKIIEQFWNSSDWMELQALCLTLPHITCILYDRQGNVVEMRDVRVIDVLWGVQKVEQAFFVNSWNMKGKQEREVPKMDDRHKQNRATHKYFLHHRAA